MEFISILIVLGLVQLWGSGGPVQRDDWFARWMATVKGMLGPGKLRLVLLVGLPVVVILFLHALFYSVLLGLLSLILYVLVLLFSLGRGDFNESLHRYLFAWNSGDFESAYDKALAIGDFHQSNNIGDAVELHQHVRHAMVYEGYQRWFAPVFWFVVLGPVGALGYRLSYLCARSNEMDETDRQRALEFIHYLDWVPARLLAATFALTGDFVSSVKCFWKQVLEDLPIPELLEQCALAAQRGCAPTPAPEMESSQILEVGGEELKTLHALISRTVIAWIIILAVAALAGA